MGIHTGEPLSSSDRYVGMDVHRAARICAAGHGGQILLSQADPRPPAGHGTCRTSISATSGTPAHGIPSAERLYQVVAPGPPVGFPSPSLARHCAEQPAPSAVELRRPRRCDRRGGASVRESYLVTLTGTGGVGKTRLAYEVGAPPWYLLPRRRLARGARLAHRRRIGRRRWSSTALHVKQQPQTPRSGRPRRGHRGTRRLLLILDNCEHLLEAGGRVVDGCSAPARGDFTSWPPAARRSASRARASSRALAGAAGCGRRPRRIARQSRNARPCGCSSTGRARSQPVFALTAANAGRRRPDLPAAGRHPARHRAGGRAGARPCRRSRSRPASTTASGC